MILSPRVAVMISESDYGSSAALEVTFKAAPGAGWASALCMLYFNRLEAVQLKDRSSGISLAIRGPKGKASKFAIHDARLHDHTIWFDEKQLGALIGFFLTYLRDGKADGSHLDLEADPVSHTGKPLDVVIKVPDAKPRLSQDDLLSQLDSE